MTNASTAGLVVGFGVFVVGMILLFQLQWHHLRCSEDGSVLTTGLARTVLDLLKDSKHPGHLAVALERNHFRSVKVCAFSPDGDVILDSASPCATQDMATMAASQRQVELYRAFVQAEGKTGTGHLTVGTLYRPCDASGSTDPQLTTFSGVRDKGGIVVVATSCGHDN